MVIKSTIWKRFEANEITFRIICRGHRLKLFINMKKHEMHSVTLITYVSLLYSNKKYEPAKMATYLAEFKQLDNQIEDIHKTQKNSIEKILEELTSKYKNLLDDEEYDKENESSKKRKINVKGSDLKNRLHFNGKHVTFSQNASKYPIQVELEKNELTADSNFVSSGDVTIDSINSSSFPLPICNSTLLSPVKIQEKEIVIQNSTKKTHLREKKANPIHVVRNLRSNNCNNLKDYPSTPKSVERKIEIAQNKKVITSHANAVQANERNRDIRDRKVKAQRQATLPKKEERVGPVLKGNKKFIVKTKRHLVETKNTRSKILKEEKPEILNYDIKHITDDFSEDDHDDKYSKKSIPSWAKAENLEPLLNIQARLNKSATVYPWFNKDHLAAPSLKDLFSDIVECPTRTSSVIWDHSINSSS